MNTSDPQWSEPNEVHVTRVDVPFLELTWFFVKASLAMALAFSVTSWLWVVIGTGVMALSAGLLLLLGVPGWFAVDRPAVQPLPPPTVLSAPPPLIVAPPPPPVVLDEAEEEIPVDPVPVDPNNAATEALMRAELERRRREQGVAR
jgi:hypothetical protein